MLVLIETFPSSKVIPPLDPFPPAVIATVVVDPLATTLASVSVSLYDVR